MAEAELAPSVENTDRFAMPDRVFIQRTRLGRTIFVLRDAEIEVSQEIRGTLANTHFPLRLISSDYTVKTVQHHVAVAISLALVACCAGGLVYVFKHDSIPPIFGYFPAYGLVIFLIVALKLTPRFVVLEFADHRAKPLFSILREKEQANECDAFLRDLLDRIERAGSADGPIQTAPLPEPETADDIDAAPEWRWQVALVAGAFACLAPIVAHLVPGMSLFKIPTFLLGAVVACTATLYSFIENERKKFWSVIGIALVVVVYLLP